MKGQGDRAGRKACLACILGLWGAGWVSVALCTCAAEKPMTDADGKEDHQKGEATIEWEVADTGRYK